MNIGQALLSVRKSNAYRQNVVCSAVGITQTYLSQIETGAKVPSIEVIEKLCRFYGIPFGIIMWMAISESDVQKKKRRMFEVIKPSVDALIRSAFNI